MIVDMNKKCQKSVGMNKLLPFEWCFAGGPRVLCLLDDDITD